MAEPLDRPTDAVPAAVAEEDLMGRLVHALAAHGVLDVAVAAAEQSDRLAAIALKELSDPAHTRALRNVLLLSEVLAILPAAEILAAFSEPAPERISLPALFRRVRSPEARRGLYRILRVLEALGAGDEPPEPAAR